MKIVVQRVKSAQCEIDGEIISEIKSGLLLFTCLERGDNQETVEAACHKILNLRIFEDSEGKMNFNIQQVKGAILNISQFTLAWDGNKGHRPSFEKSMGAREANLKFELMTRKLGEFVDTQKGEFGADMQIKLINDGPVTFCLSL